MEPKIRTKIIQFVLLFLFFTFVTEKAFSQPTPPGGQDFGTSAPITIYTPTNEPLNAVTYTDVPDWVAYWEALGSYYISINSWDAAREGPATHDYNCHGYAWYVSENGSHCWINYTELPKYWGGQHSYIQDYTNAIGRKVRFTNDDHSAITTSSSSYLRSKWGKLPLYKHLVSNCPYISTGLTYYALNSNMTGSTSLLCVNVERSYNTNITNMPGASLTWTPGPYIEHVGGSGNYEYRIRGIGNGFSSVGLQINTPSGFSWSNTKNFYAGKPVLSNQKVDGYNYYTGYQICPGNHWLGVTVTGEGAGYAVWTIPPGIVYHVGYNQLDFTFPYSWSSIAITANSTNGCGTTSNTPFYLTKKTYGCSGLLGMTVFPNPASDNVTITIIEDDPLVVSSDSSYTSDLKESNTQSAEIRTYTVSIFNSQSALLCSIKRSGKSFNIPLINMPDGTYIIEVSNRETKYSQPLIVKHY